MSPERQRDFSMRCRYFSMNRLRWVVAVLLIKTHESNFNSGIEPCKRNKKSKNLIEKSYLKEKVEPFLQKPLFSSQGMKNPGKNILTKFPIRAGPFKVGGTKVGPPIVLEFFHGPRCDKGIPHSRKVLGKGYGRNGRVKET